MIDDVDEMTVWMQGFTLFMMSLFAIFHINGDSKHLFPSGGDNVCSNIGWNPYILRFDHKSGIEHNKDNERVVNGDYLNRHVNTPMIVILIGVIIGCAAYPPTILYSCFGCLIASWIMSYLKIY